MINVLVCFYVESIEKLIQIPFHAVYKFNLLWTGTQSKFMFCKTSKEYILISRSKNLRKPLYIHVMTFFRYRGLYLHFKLGQNVIVYMHVC